jgi:hypothetical protein
MKGYVKPGTKGESFMKLIPANYEPQPEAIDASRHLWNAFDHSETEISAGWIVRLCQSDGVGWKPFSRTDIEFFYGRKVKDGFTFNKLIERGWIIEDTDGNFHFTDEFVNRCFASSPAAERKSA